MQNGTTKIMAKNVALKTKLGQKMSEDEEWPPPFLVKKDFSKKYQPRVETLEVDITLLHNQLHYFSQIQFISDQDHEKLSLPAQLWNLITFWTIQRVS